MGFIDRFDSKHLKVESEICAHISLQTCNKLMELKKKLIQLDNKVKKEKNKQIIMACDRIKEVCYNFLEGKDTSNQNIYYMEGTAILSNKPFIKIGVIIYDPINKNLPILMKRITILYENLSKINITDLSLAVNILKLSNPKLKTGQKILSTYFKKNRVSDIANTIKKDLNELLEISDQSTDLLDIRGQNESKDTVKNQVCRTIESDYTEIRRTGKNLLNEYQKILETYNEVKKKNSQSIDVPNLDYSTAKEEIKNFLESMKLIKAETTEYGTMRNEIFDNRILESLQRLPLKIVTKIFDLIMAFFKGEIINLPASLTLLNLEGLISKAKMKLEAIKNVQYGNDNTNTNDVDFYQKKARRAFEDSRKVNEIKLPEDISTLNRDQIEKTIENQVSYTPIKTTLDNLKAESGGDTIYYLALISELTNQMNIAFNKMYKYFLGIYLTCIEMLNSTQKSNILSKISSVTGVLSTIGCFAGFAMSSICPIVGWVIFGVCCAAFACNLANAITKTVIGT